MCLHSGLNITVSPCSCPRFHHFTTPAPPSAACGDLWANVLVKMGSRFLFLFLPPPFWEGNLGAKARSGMSFHGRQMRPGLVNGSPETSSCPPAEGAHAAFCLSKSSGAALPVEPRQFS